MAEIKATIFCEKGLWKGHFERADQMGYAVACHIFGQEPTDPEVYDYILTHYHELKFGEAQEVTIKIKRMNPKRLQREVRREMKKIKETERPSTHAQDYMREMLEKNKKEKKQLKSQRMRERREQQFKEKQEKKKRKHKGH